MWYKGITTYRSVGGAKCQTFGLSAAPWMAGRVIATQAASLFSIFGFRFT